MNLRVWLQLILLTVACVCNVYAESRMCVHCIDVGQGCSTLLEFECGAILVDAGGESNSEFDSNQALMSYLDAFFARRTDLNNRLSGMIVSHPHIDHTRGLDKVLAKYRPKTAVTDGLMTGSGKAGQVHLQKAASDAESTADPSDDIQLELVDLDEIGDAGYTNTTIDSVNCSGIDPVVRVLWGKVSADDFKWNKQLMGNANLHSVVVRVDFGEASILLPGDLEEEGINQLVKKFGASGLLDVDVYMVGHHGSRNGLTQELVDKMSPKIAVLPTGSEARHLSWTAWAYGHPNAGILRILERGLSQSRPSVTVKVASGAKKFSDHVLTKAIYATGWDGNVELEADAKGHWTVLNDQPELASERVNINTASAEELAQLDYIGAKRAQAIIDYRNAHGKFERIEDLDNVPGIGPATIEAIRSSVTIE